MVAALLRGKTPTVRMFGAVAVAAAIGYVFTPLTASGPEGQPDGFAINLRYLAPALALGMALLPLDRASTGSPGRRSSSLLMVVTAYDRALLATPSSPGRPMPPSRRRRS